MWGFGGCCCASVVVESKDVTSVYSLSYTLESGRSGIANTAYSNYDDGVQLPDDGGIEPEKEEEKVRRKSSQPPFLRDDDPREEVNEDGLLSIIPEGNVVFDGGQQLMATHGASDVVSSADYTQDRIDTDEIEIIDSALWCQAI